MLPTRISSAWPSQDGTGLWEFLWWDTELSGHRVRRKAVIGTVQRYPNIEDTWQASNGLRVSINEARNRQQEQSVTVADLVDHYTSTELNRDLSDAGSHKPQKPFTKAFLRDGSGLLGAD